MPYLLSDIDHLTLMLRPYWSVTRRVRYVLVRGETKCDLTIDGGTDAATINAEESSVDAIVLTSPDHADLQLCCCSRAAYDEYRVAYL